MENTEVQEVQMDPAADLLPGIASASIELPDEACMLSERRPGRVTCPASSQIKPAYQTAWYVRKIVRTRTSP